MFVVTEGIMAIIFALILGIALVVLFIAALKKSEKASVMILFISLICIALGIGIWGSKRMLDTAKVVGVYSGAENEKLEINGVLYVADYNAPYNSPDKDKLLGKALWKNSSANYNPMYIWTVKGTDEYVYALHVYDGVFFKKAE